MIIKKDKDITIKISSLLAVGLIIVTIICHIIGSIKNPDEFNNIQLLIFIIIGELLIPVIIAVLIIIFTKKYYEITEESIKYFNGTKLVFELNKKDIVKMEFVRFRWALLMRFGAGGLNIEYVDNDSIQPTIAMKGKWKIYVISLSYKQAIRLSEILKKPVYKK